MSWALVGFATGGGGAGTARFAATLVGSLGRDGAFGGAGLAPAGPSTAGAAGDAAGATLPAASIVARSRRATGGSIVLDADFTYSPIS
jgi:hypothetical protein